MDHMTAMGVLGAFLGSMAGNLSTPREIAFGLLTIGLCCVFHRKRIAIPLALALGVVFAIWVHRAHYQYLGYPSDLIGLLFASHMTGITLLGLIGMGIGLLARKHLMVRK
jgi:hypothetical protein